MIQVGSRVTVKDTLEYSPHDRFTGCSGVVVAMSKTWYLVQIDNEKETYCFYRSELKEEESCNKS